MFSRPLTSAAIPPAVIRPPGSYQHVRLRRRCGSRPCYLVRRRNLPNMTTGLSSLDRPSRSEFYASNPLLTRGLSIPRGSIGARRGSYDFAQTCWLPHPPPRSSHGPPTNGFGRPRRILRSTFSASTPADLERRCRRRSRPAAASVARHSPTLTEAWVERWQLAAKDSSAGWFWS